MVSDLPQLPNITRSSLELLEAAGFRTLKDLAGANEGELAAEMQRANGLLQLAVDVPGRSEVGQWIEHAREVFPNEPARERLSAKPPAPSVVAELAKVSAALPMAPFAIPLPGHLLEERGLLVADIPEALRIDGHPEAAGGDAGSRIPGVQSMAIYSGPTKTEADFSRFRSMEGLEKAAPRRLGTAEEISNDRVALIRAPKTSTNEGVDPSSRRFIRGVLHNHPTRIYLGAALTLTLLVLSPLSAAAAALLLLSRESSDGFAWVPGWFLAFPFSLPLLGLLWLFYGYGGSCRVCGQRLFVHRSHRKNAKAHHLPVLGYIIPLCVHILLFRWFRCTHCGTPVRLKS